MKFAIITHVPHIFEQNQYFAYAPYVREMNIWSKYVTELVIVAPKSDEKKSEIHISYEHLKITFVPIDNFNILNLSFALNAIFKIPKICSKIYLTMKDADHIHLRCPGNIGLLGCFVQILFPKKIKTAKYASNWDLNSKQPLSYKLQRWILNNRFLTRNMQVLVYGDWKNSTKNVKSFFTATYYESEKQDIIIRNTTLKPIRFLFVGTLTKGKNPFYGIEIVKALNQLGILATIDLFGDGILFDEISFFIKDNNLEENVFLRGNKSKKDLIDFYRNSHFLILQSGSFEGWPKVVAESMFWGCVPLAIPTSVVPQMLDNGNRGLLLTGNFQKDLDNIANLIQNNDLYQQKANSALIWSRNYTLDKFENEIKKLII